VRTNQVVFVFHIDECQIDIHFVGPIGRNSIKTIGRFWKGEVVSVIRIDHSANGNFPNGYGVEIIRYTGIDDLCGLQAIMKQPRKRLKVNCASNSVF
jgi:hypothetical protein